MPPDRQARRYLAGMAAGAAGEFLLLWAWVAAAPLSFLDPEYPYWRAKQAMLEACDLGELLILGDSRAAAGILAADLPMRATNLAVGGGKPVEAYAALLESADPATREKAAQDWCDWEAAIISTDPGHKPHPRYADPRFRMAFARIVTHYFRNGGFLESNQILRNAHRLKGIPGVLIHGRRDLGTPLAGVEALAKVWPESELIVIDEAGHETKTPGVVEGIVASTDAFRTAL